LFAAVLALFAGIVLLTNNWYHLNRGFIEMRLFPVVEDGTARNWTREEDGFWSAQVYLNKVRPGCIYVPDQIVTAIGTTPYGYTFEASVVYIGDRTPNSNRNEGWQRLDDRVEFQDPLAVVGSTVTMHVLHDCHDSPPTASQIGPFVIGQDSPWPDSGQWTPVLPQ
jgi:hypothetical protein